MYRDFDDPWEQTALKYWASENAVTYRLIQELNANRVIELGCGLGHYTNKIRQLGFDVLGVDISSTAIEKARKNYPNCKFTTGDILDFKIYEDFRPEVIIMAEITWYVLDKLDEFIKFIKSNFRDTYLIHLLTTYPSGEQNYGKEKFTNLQEIMSYFAAEYLEWGDYSSKDGYKTTYFVGRWQEK